MNSLWRGLNRMSLIMLVVDIALASVVIAVFGHAPAVIFAFVVIFVATEFSVRRTR
jgi:hypothetical protein